MKRIRQVSEVVEDVLKADKSARNSDIVLYLKVCKRMNPAVSGLAFETVLMNLNDFGLPKPESVGRARRKIQSINADLRADEEVTDGRYEAFKEVIDYATEL